MHSFIVCIRYGANRVNDSRICYELLQRGYVIPKNTGYHEYVRPMKDVFERDRGGMIIPPKAGGHICSKRRNNIIFYLHTVTVEILWLIFFPSSRMCVLLVVA